jgi:peptide subunit release factor 1 (eRF1)
MKVRCHHVLVGRCFDEFLRNTGRYCFGVEDTMHALKLGSVHTLICWENLDIQRYVLENCATTEKKILHLTPEQAKDKKHFRDKEVSGITYRGLNVIQMKCYLGYENCLVRILLVL